MTSGPKLTSATQKKAYKTPSLTTYGQLKDLTTGGSAKGKEGGTGNGNKKA